MTILRVGLETAGKAKILYKLTLGEVNTNIPEIGSSRALITVQDAMTLKTCKATEGMKKVVMANAGSTAKSQCSTDGVTPCAGSTATTRREQSDARGRAGVRHEPYRRQTHG